jgi:hypothetical protein
VNGEVLWLVIVSGFGANIKKGGKHIHCFTLVVRLLLNCWTVVCCSRLCTRELVFGAIRMGIECVRASM